MGWADRYKKKEASMAAGRKFLATINITIKRVNQLPNGQLQVSHARMIEATGEADAMQGSVQAAFADGLEEWVAALPATDGPMIVAPGPDGH